MNPNTPSPQHPIASSPIAPPLRYSISSPSRLDAFLATAAPEFSRSRWQDLIREGHVTVNGKTVKPNHTLRTGDTIDWTLPPTAPTELVPEDLKLDVLFEDADLIVLNKPPGLVVHPAPGHSTGTLVHGLLHHCDDLAGIGGEERPGIVHRLDRDTSGCLVVAKTEPALNALAAQFKDRDVKKEYVALVWGTPSPRTGTVRTLIARDPHHRQRMSAKVKAGREAVSHYEVLETWDDLAFVRIRIETGRTHQIRVHMAHLHHPVAGDALYGRAHPHHALTPLLVRQMLHAERIAFRHPTTGQDLAFAAPLPPDFRAVLTALRREPAP